MNKKSLQVTKVAHGSLAIALICVFFLMFKGIANILNAFFVPVTLYVFSLNKKKEVIITVYAAAILFCALFFHFQLPFLFFYCGFAFLLRVLIDKNIHKGIAIIILALTVSLGFTAAIVITDYVFSTHINDIMIKISGGEIINYALILLFEGTLIGTGLFFTSKKLCSSF